MTEINHKLQLAAELAGRGKVSRRDFVQLALAAGLTLAAANTMFAKAVRAEPKKGGTLRIGLAHGADHRLAGSRPLFRPGHRHSLLGHAVEQPDRDRSRRQCGSRSRRELRAVRRRQEVGVQAAQGRHLPQRQDGDRRRRRRVATGITWARTRNRPPSRCSSRSQRSRPTARRRSSSSSTAAMPTSPTSPRDYHIPIMPAKDGGGVDWESGIRTGPYVLEKFEPGVIATFKRNPNYFKTGQGLVRRGRDARRSPTRRRAPTR